MSSHFGSTAGSETTATTLSCATYYLLKYPEVLRKLQKEIRSTFSNYNEINAQSTASLRYLHAVCLEALRIYAPLPFALPRVVPEGGDTVDGHYLPAGVNPPHRSTRWRSYKLITSLRSLFTRIPSQLLSILQTSKHPGSFGPKDG